MTPEASGPCPERDVLEQLAAGATADGDSSRHLASCPRCMEALESIRRDNELLGEFIGANLDGLTGDAVPDHRVDGYEIIHEIHRGGQGIVYEAEQTATRRTVAIKMMLQGRFATSKRYASSRCASENELSSCEG